MKPELRKLLGPGISLVLFGAVVWLLRTELKTYHFNDILKALTAISGSMRGLVAK